MGVSFLLFVVWVKMLTPHEVFFSSLQYRGAREKTHRAIGAFRRQPPGGLAVRGHHPEASSLSGNLQKAVGHPFCKWDVQAGYRTNDKIVHP